MPKYLGHSKVEFELGASFNPLDPWTLKQNRGLVTVPPQPANTAEPSRIEYDFLVATQEHHYIEKLQINAKLELKWALASANASGSFSKDINIDETSFSLILSAKKTYSSDTYAGAIDLSERGKTLLNTAAKSNKIQEFAKLTGTEIVTSVTRAHSLLVVYHFKTSSKTQKEKLVTKLSAKWGESTGNLNFRKEMEEIDKESTLHIKVLEDGGEATHESIATLISTDPNKIADIKKLLAQALIKSTKSTALVIEANTEYLHEVVPDIIFYTGEGNTDPASVYSRIVSGTNEADRFTDEIYKKYKFLSIQIDRIDQLLDPRILNSHYKKDAKEQLKSLREQYLAQKKTCKDVYDRLVVAGSPNLQLVDLQNQIEQIKLKEIKYLDYIHDPLIYFVKWHNPDVVAGRDGNSENWFFDHKFYLTLAITNASHLVSRVEIFVNDILFVKSLNSNNLGYIIDHGGSTESIFELNYHQPSSYQWGHECRYCEGTKAVVKKAHENLVKGNQYKAIIFTTDGHQYELMLGNPMKPAVTLFRTMLEETHSFIPPQSTTVYLSADATPVKLINLRGLFASTVEVPKESLLQDVARSVPLSLAIDDASIGPHKPLELSALAAKGENAPHVAEQAPSSIGENNDKTPIENTATQGVRSSN